MSGDIGSSVLAFMSTSGICVTDAPRFLIRYRRVGVRCRRLVAPVWSPHPQAAVEIAERRVRFPPCPPSIIPDDLRPGVNRSRYLLAH
jgi:hypothetical protein